MAYTVFLCSDTKDVIDLLQYQQRVHIDVNVTSLGHHLAKVQRTTAGKSIDAMVTDLWHHLTENSREA